MPFFAAIGGILKIASKVLKIGGKVIAVTQAAGGVVNNATTPYYSEAGQRVQAIMNGLPHQQPVEPVASSPPPAKVQQTITHDSNGNMIGYISGAEVTAKKSSLPTWLPYAALGVLAILVLRKK